MSNPTASSKVQLLRAVRTARKYTVIIYLVFFLSIYGFLAWRTISLSQVEPDQSAVTAELKTSGVPKIDQEVLNKIQQLQDNSVSVQTLFEEARSNPFQE